MCDSSCPRSLHKSFRPAGNPRNPGEARYSGPGPDVTDVPGRIGPAFPKLEETFLAVKIVRQEKNIALLGAPTSAAALAAGHERGPAALRAAGLVARLTEAGFL